MKLNTETGSFINHLYSCISEKPEVGKGATQLMWTDRRAYFVNEVSNNSKTVVLESTNAIRTDDLGMTDSGQTYRFERTGQTFTIKFKWGKWRTSSNGVFNVVFGKMDEYYDYSF